MNLCHGGICYVTLWHWRFSVHPWILWSTAGKWDAFAALLWTYFEIPFHDAFTNGEMRTPNSCLRKPKERLQSGPEIIPRHPGKIFWHADWSSVGSLISLLSIIQSSFTFEGVHVCSSWSNSICMTMLGFQRQHFWSSIFIVTSTMARRPEHHVRISKFFPLKVSSRMMLAPYLPVSLWIKRFNI